MIASVKPPLGLKKRILSKLQLKQSKLALGAQGESQALSFLIQKQYRILATNVVSKVGELDIVAYDALNDEIVFVEVKTRSSNWAGHPSLAVNYRKKRAWQAAARDYLRLQQLEKSYRFDIISVLPGKIEHFENVTW